MCRMKIALEVLIPGNFLIGRPLCTLPYPISSHQTMSLLKCWDLCQNLLWHFQQRWFTEYLVSLNKFSKWHRPIKNLQVGDVVVLQEDTNTYQVAFCHSVSSPLWEKRSCEFLLAKGTYRRPVTKLVPLLPNTD